MRKHWWVVRDGKRNIVAHKLYPNRVTAKFWLKVYNDSTWGPEDGTIERVKVT